MKSGNVVLVGRPNAGKSTLLNALIDHKISITSPKPQTTRRIIKGYWWDDHHQIIFWDTPGIFTKIKDQVGKKINLIPGKALLQADLILYLIDRSRPRGREENQLLGMVRKANRPTILVLNKIDKKKPDYSHEYQFLREEFDHFIEISALKKINLKPLMEMILLLLPEGEPLFDPKKIPPLQGEITPKQLISDLIQEKLFLKLRQELPYTTGVKTEEIEERKDLFYIKATIFTISDKYKKMIIGHQGEMIKRIGTAARQEIELITGKKVYLDLEVVTDPHWPEYLLS